MSFIWSDTKLRSQISSISDLVHNELIRYIQKGSGLIGALSITLFYFFILPSLFYPIFLKFANQNLYWMFTVGSSFAYLSGLLLANLALNIIYSAKSRYFEKFKVQHEPWPWEKDPKAYKILRDSIGKSFIIHNFILLPLVNYLPVVLGIVELNLSPLDYPSTFEIIIQIIFCMIIDDLVFYFSHRTLHSPWLYRTIHKKHHEAKATFGWVATYAHPIEFIFGDLLPAGVGMIILGNRCHIVTSYLWTFLKIIETTDGHCGYDFPWSPFRLLPMSAGSSYHCFHHSHNVGNFGSFFTVWDTLFGTNQKYLSYSAKMKLEKNN